MAPGVPNYLEHGVPNYIPGKKDTFEEYESLYFTLGQSHPDPVVETTSLSFANLPDDIDQALDLPSAIFRPKSDANPLGGALSRLQLETIAYASRRHATDLPSGERSGFFLGDGVGLGKGRQLAGLIVHNMRKAKAGPALRRRHVWVSVSQDLSEDAKRDLRDALSQLRRQVTTRPHMPSHRKRCDSTVHQLSTHDCHSTMSKTMHQIK